MNLYLILLLFFVLTCGVVFYAYKKRGSSVKEVTQTVLQDESNVERRIKRKARQLATAVENGKKAIVNENTLSNLRDHRKQIRKLKGVTERVQKGVQKEYR